ncbi:benzoate/H(+) symporter BenE family transporter, partial [Acinetobacter baumannii]|nr:benzoate/H(+) symporter BenE family transporter [Acinetobacter baumannii]
GYTVPVSALIVVCGGLALLLAPFGVYSICIAAITAAICQSPEAHPDPNQRWLAAIAAGGFYLLAGLFGGSITALMSALPPAWIQMLAGLALLGTIGGSLFQAVHQASERDAAVLTFLVTPRGGTLAGNWSPLLGGGVRGGGFWGAFPPRPPPPGGGDGRGGLLTRGGNGGGGQKPEA